MVTESRVKLWPPTPPRGSGSGSGSGSGPASLPAASGSESTYTPSPASSAPPASPRVPHLRPGGRQSGRLDNSQILSRAGVTVAEAYTRIGHSRANILELLADADLGIPTRSSKWADGLDRVLSSLARRHKADLRKAEEIRKRVDEQTATPADRAWLLEEVRKRDAAWEAYQRLADGVEADKEALAPVINLVKGTTDE